MPPSRSENGLRQDLRRRLGDRLSARRRELRLPLKDIAARAGLSVSYLNEIEHGRKYPQPDRLVALAGALDLDLASLLGSPGPAEGSSFPAGSTPPQGARPRRQSPPNSPAVTLAPAPASGTPGDPSNIDWQSLGLPLETLREWISDDPSRFNILIETLVRVARMYNRKFEPVMAAALRTQREIQRNYFPEWEETGAALRQDLRLAPGQPPSLEQLTRRLATRHQYRVRLAAFTGYPDLGSLVALTIPGEKPLLLLNQRLVPARRRFLLARELATVEAGLHRRPHANPAGEITDFAELLQDFQADYLAGTLTLDREPFIARLREEFSRRHWNPAAWNRMLRDFHTTPEYFAARLMQVLDPAFGLENTAYTRFHFFPAEDRFLMVEDLHHTRLQNPHGIGFFEHYCRRWLSFRLLHSLARRKTPLPPGEWILEAQRNFSQEDQSERFALGFCRPLLLDPGCLTSVTLSFELSPAFKRVVNFWNDPAIPRRIVGLTCERCGLPDCRERVAPARILDQARREQRVQAQIQQLVLDLRRP